MWTIFTSSVRYLGVILRHKFYVFVAGLRLKVPIARLIKHDMSKFSRAEFSQYRQRFYGDAKDPVGFKEALLHHYNSNDHHWEYWIILKRSFVSDGTADTEAPVPMPKAAVREMVADWMGASIAYGGEWATVHEWGWFVSNWPTVSQRMHATTRARVFDVMREAGYHHVLEKTAESKAPKSK